LPSWRWTKLSTVQRAVLGLTALVVVLQLSLGLSLLAHEKRTLYRQSDERARTMAQIATAGTACQKGDVAQTANRIGKSLRMQKDVLLCEIKDSKGNVKFQEESPHPGPARQYTFRLPQDESRAGSHAGAVPSDRLAEGTLTIALSLDPARRTLAASRATVATSVLASLGLTWLFAGLLLRQTFRLPMRRLLQKARGACAPCMFENTPADSDNEIACLEETLDALDAAYRQLATRERRLAAQAVSGQIEHKRVTELRAAYARLEQVNKELDDFAYVVSHDLKAPLRHIKSLVEWITSDCSEKLAAEQSENFHLLVSQVDRMHALIEGILQYSRAGRSKEETVTFDATDAVAEAIELTAPPDTIRIEVRDALPTLTLERTRIVQVFQNLLSNAVKFMDKPDGRIVIGCHSRQGYWTFSVADNGPGIDEKHHQRIFRMFQTLQPSDSYESTGIGLTLVKKIVEIYGGKIWVESRPGAGSTFFFTLPQEQKETQHEKLQTGTAC